MSIFRTQKNSCLVLGMLFGLVFASLFFATLAHAAFNPMINYQGKLTTDTGATVPDGTYNMRFWLLTSPSIATTSAVWSETLTGADQVQVQNGLFSIMLGSTTPLTSVDFNQTLYLGVEIGGTGAPAWDGEMSPRKIIGAVPAAFEAEHAADADTVGGVASTSFLRSDQADSASGLLTFTGGIISNSSSTVSSLNFTTATGTTLVINGEAFTDFTGTALSNAGGVLSVDTSALSTYFASTTDFDTCSELAAILAGNTTGTCGSFVLSASPTFTGTVNAAAATLSSTLTLSGSAANIALGSNWLSGDGGDEGVFVASDGDVGIGTSTPNQALTIFRNGADAAIEFSTVSGPNEKWTIGIDDSDGAKFKISSSSALGTNDRFTINGAGNVGINTINPAKRLHVNGDGLFGVGGDYTNSASITTPLMTLSANQNSTGGVTMRNSSTGSSADFRFALEDTGSRYMAFAMPGTGYSGTLFGINRNTAGFLFTNGPSNDGRILALGTVQNNDVLFASDNVERMRILSTGEVGIGTSTPSSKLTVYGDAFLEGTNRYLSFGTATGSSGYGFRDNTGTLEFKNSTHENWSPVIGQAGINWATTTLGSDDGRWNSVTYGNGLFVAVGGGSSVEHVAISPDGINWATTTAAGDNDSWTSVAYGNGLFVAVGASGDRVMTSPDGITWTARSAAGDNDTWQEITYGNGLFVAVASGASGDHVMTSPDGITWTGRSAAGDNDTWNSVTYGSGLFVAVGQGLINDRVMTSPDGITWTAQTALGDDDTWKSVTYGNGHFVAVGHISTGDIVMTSPDGISWTTQSAAGGDDGWQSVTYGNGIFVAVADCFLFGGSDCAMYSGAQSQYQLAHNNIYQGGLSILGDNVGIGTSSPSQLLHVAGSVRIEDFLYDADNSAGTAGMVLQTTATGTRWVATSTLGISGGASTFLSLSDVGIASFNDGRILFESATEVTDSSSLTFANSRLTAPVFNASGASTTIFSLNNVPLLTASSAASFIALGYDNGTSTDNNGNSIFIGSGAGYNAIEASFSNFIGSNAGFGATFASASNFIGISAGNNATSADNSNFMGNEAGSGAVFASQSNFFGNGAGQDATNANDSNFFGNGAGNTATNAAYSNFFGESAGILTTNANYSNFFGTQAGAQATNAATSTFIGYQAGYQATNASNALFLGANAGYNDTVNNTSNGGSSIAIGRYAGTGGFSNSIALGRGVINSAATQLNIGNVLYATGIYNSDTQSAAPTAGNIGIGTTTPHAKLTVTGTAGSASTSPLFAVSSSTPLTGGDYVTISGRGFTELRGRAIDPEFIAEEVDATTLNGASSVFVSGNYAYVANDTRDSLAIIDISNPADPVFVAEEQGTTPGTTLNGASSVFVSGNYAYVANDNRDSLAIIDISNPADPVFIAEEVDATTLNGAVSVFVSGNYAYVANDGRDSLAIIDISNPADPVFVAEEQGTTPGTTLNSASSVFVSGNYAYVANSIRASLVIIDISNPADPVFVAEEVNATSLEAASSVFVSGNYAYVATGGSRDSLVVIDISNPADPVFVAEEQNPRSGASLTNSSSVFVSGNYAYVANSGDHSLAIFDVSSPVAPVFVVEERGPTPDTTLNGAVSVFVSGNYAYVANRIRDSLAIIDVGGASISNFAAGSAKINNLLVDSHAQFTQGINIGSSLNVGSNALINGALTIQGTASSSLLSSNTNAALVVSTGRVGIGTSTPSSKLDIYGTAGSDDIFAISSSTNSRLLTFTSGGNLGIGSTTPSSKLTVSGDTYIGGDLTATGSLAILGTATSTFAGGISITGSIIPTADITYDLGSATNQWRDVYIGPGSLYVNGKKVIEDVSNTITISTDVDQNLITETTGLGNVTMRATGSGNANINSGSGNINITSTSGNLNIGTSGSGQLNLGTVTTGTWQGSAIGAVYGGTAQTTYATGDMLYASGVNTLAKRTVGSTGDVLSVVGGVPTWVATSTLGISGGGGLTAADIDTYAELDAIVADVTLTHNGLIDTSAELLAIVGDETGTGALVFGTSPTFAGTPVFSGGVVNFSTTTIFTIPNNESAAFVFATSTTGTSLLTIDTTSGSEEVQIGTPGGDVIIGGVGSPSNLVFEEDATIHGQGGNTLTFGQSGDVINFAVNTGFNTASPSELLHVNGNFRLAGAFKDSANATGTSGMVLQSTGTSTQWVATSTLGITGGSSFSDSAGLAAVLSDETGTGRAVFSNSPAFSGTATFSALTATGTATFSTVDINGGAIDGTTIGAASASSIIGTTIQANTGFLPDSDGGAYLGQATQAFSGLFLDTGATINFDNGNSVLTHSSGILTVSTGDLRVTTAGTNAASVVTVGGTQTLTSKTLTAPTISAATLSGITTFSSLTASRALFTDASSQATTTALSAALLASLTDETGTGALVFGTSPTFAGTPIFGGGEVNFSTDTIFTIPNNSATAFTFATSSTASPLFTIDTTSGSENVTLGPGSGDVIIGDVGATTNLVFEEDATIHGQGGNTLTFGQSGDVINFAVNTGFGTSTPSQELTVAGDVRITGALFDSNNASGTSGMVLQSTGSGFAWVATSTLGFTGGGGLASTDIDTCSELAAILTGNTTGTCGTFVLSASPTFTGTVGTAALAATGNITSDSDIYTTGAGDDLWLGNATQASANFQAYATGELRIDADSTSLILGEGQDATLQYDGANLLINPRAVGSGHTLFSAGNVGIGTTTPGALLSMEKTSGLTGSVIAGLHQYFNFQNSSASAVYYGDNTYIVNAPTATSTLVGKILRIDDSTVLGNTVRGLEVQAHRGTNTQGENTGISGFGRTFGVRGTTEGDAGGTFQPAGVFAQTRGTTQGNALRAYSGSITTEDLVSLFQDTSAFTGTGLVMNFGNSGGSFSSTTSKFVDFQNAGTSKFTVTAHGTTTIGDGTTTYAAGLQIGYGGLCVDNDGSCTASTTGRITSVSSAVGNSDLAEMYFGEDDLQPGEIIATVGILSIEKAHHGNAENIIGVVSTKPGLTLGFDDSSLIEGQTGYPVALKGRVPVKLSTENGPIKAGDKIMLSSIPGIGMKATEGGTVVGTALEDFDGEYAYSEGFIDQFGDDIAEPDTTPDTVETDERIHDGCYFGGGGALGEEEEECTPRDTERFASVEVAISDESEEMQEALMELGGERAEEMETEDGTEVKVGQALMFVNLDSYQTLAQTDLLNDLTSTSTDLVLDGNGEETLWDRVKALAQGFVDGVLSVAGLRAENVYVENELCVDGVCVTADDLRALLINANQPHNGSGNGEPPPPPPTEETPPEEGETGTGEDQTEEEEDTQQTTEAPPQEEPPQETTAEEPEAIVQEEPETAEEPPIEEEPEPVQDPSVTL